MMSIKEALEFEKAYARERKFLDKIELPPTAEEESPESDLERDRRTRLRKKNVI